LARRSSPRRSSPRLRAQDDQAQDDQPEDDQAEDDQAQDDQAEDDQAQDDQAQDDKDSAQPPIACPLPVVPRLVAQPRQKPLESLAKSLGKSRGGRLPSGLGKAIVAAYPRRLKRLILDTDIAFYGIVPAGRFARCPLRLLPTENHV
jgi:hypothetical protein